MRNIIEAGRKIAAITMCLLCCTGTTHAAPDSCGRLCSEAQSRYVSVASYGRCVRGDGGELRDTLRRYCKSVVRENGKLSLAKPPSVDQINDLNDCDGSLMTDAVVESSTSSLDRRMRDFHQIATSTLPTVNAAAEYYRREDFRDDDFVAGEQFDKILQQACLELDKNWLPILEALRRSQLETRRAYVSELKAKLSEQHALLIAREFANAINKRSFEELNADEIHSKLTSLEEALNSSDTHLALKSCLSDVGAPYGTLKFGEVIIHAKQLWRRVRDNKPFTDEEQRALLEELRTSGKHFNVNFSGKVEGSPIVILKMVFGCDKEFVIDKFLWASDK